MYNKNSGYGMLQAICAQQGVMTLGRIFLVMPTSDPNYDMWEQILKPDAEGKVRLFNTIADAYAAVTSNRYDTILLSAHSTHSVSAGIDWTKNRVNVVGMDGGDRLVQQGSKIELSGAVDSAYVLKNTGVRNSFRNIKFIQSSTHANALSVLQDGSEGSLYKNCSFIFGVVNNLDETTAHEVIAGSDSATFLNCTFGCDTLLTSAARSVFHIDQVSAWEFKSNILRECIFIISSSSSTATFVRLNAVGDILFTNIFDRCIFVASVDSAGGAAIAEASQTGTSTVKGVLCYHYCSVFNVTDFSTATSGRNTATQVVAAVPTAGTAGIGVAPTA